MPETNKPNQVTSDRCIALVSGYHLCSYPPPTAYDAGLKERFAVVLSSFRPDKDGMFFDADLFVLLTEAILRAIPHDAIDIEMGGGLPGLRSLRALSEVYASQGEMERDPPHRVKVSHGDRLVALAQTEAWASVGGPAPYHDSFTLALYTAENRAVEFRRLCEALARECGVTVTAFHEALTRREPYAPWWRRPLRWLGVKTW